MFLASYSKIRLSVLFFLSFIIAYLLDNWASEWLPFLWTPPFFHKQIKCDMGCSLTVYMCGTWTLRVRFLLLPTSTQVSCCGCETLFRCVACASWDFHVVHLALCLSHDCILFCSNYEWHILNAVKCTCIDRKTASLFGPEEQPWLWILLLSKLFFCCELH